MSLILVQSNFNRGEIAAELDLRDDNAQRAAGCRRALNVLSVPQGGLGRFPGLQYFATLPGKSRFEAFEFNVEQSYVIAFSDLLATVYAHGNFVATIVTPYFDDEIFDIQHPMVADQQADTMILVHEAHCQMKLMRNVGGSGTLPTLPNPLFVTLGSPEVVMTFPGPHGLVTGMTITIAGETVGGHGIPASAINGAHLITVLSNTQILFNPAAGAATATGGFGDDLTWDAPDYWSLERLVADTTEGGETTVSAGDLAFPLAEQTRITNIPLFDFQDTKTPTVTDEQQEIQFVGTWYDGADYKLYVGNYLTDRIHYRTSATENADAIQSALLKAPQFAALGAGPDDILVNNISTDTTVPPDGEGDDHKGPYRITFTGKLGNRDWADLQPKIVNNDQGGTIAISPDIRPGASGLEPVWSVIRGWPRTTVFHEQRLGFGGTPSQPASVWLSMTGDPFDFDLGQATDDDAIAYDGASDRLDAIVALVSLRKFVILTTGSEFYSNDTPTTPRNFSEQRDTARGASPIPPVLLDGSVIFVQRDRGAIRQMLYHDIEQAYTVEDLTILSRHLLSSPIDMDVLQGTLGDYVHVVNGNGTLVVLNTNRTQGVSAWTRRETRAGDKFVSIVMTHEPLGPGQTHMAWVCVERVINGATVYYLERFTNGVYLDCQRGTFTGGTLAAGALDHLEGEEVMLRLDDGRVFLTATVAGGTVTLEEPWESLDVGFNSCLPDVETVPVAPELQNGRAALRKMRINRATLDLLNSNDVWVGYGDGRLQKIDPASWSFDAPAPITGPYWRRLLGWKRRPTLRITQFSPMPWFVRGVELTVQVNS